MFSTFAYLSLGQVALHRMASDQQQKRFGNLLGSLLLMAVVLALVGWLVALGLHGFDRVGIFKGLPMLALVVGFLALPFMIWEQYGSSLLMGLQFTRIYNLYQILGRTISVVAMFILVGGLGFGVAGVLEASLLGQVVVAIGGMGFMFANARNNNLTCRPDLNEIKALITGGIKLHLNAIGVFLFTSTNILLLNKYRGAEQTGYFQLATQIIGVMMIIPQAASMVIYGKIATQGPNRAWPDNKRLLVQITLFMGALSAVAASLAPWGIILLAGEAFRPAVQPFQWMLLGVIGMTISTVMTPQCIGRGYFWQAAAFTFSVGVINLAANFWLIPLHGMQGAVCASLGTYIVSMLGMAVLGWHCQHQYKKSITCKNAVTYA
jgi:O-antigen/teichoic acid export membrane protein